MRKERQVGIKALLEYVGVSDELRCCQPITMFLKDGNVQQGAEIALVAAGTSQTEVGLGLEQTPMG